MRKHLMEAATDGRELLKGQGAKLLKFFSKTKQKLMFFTAVIVWIFSHQIVTLKY